MHLPPAGAARPATVRMLMRRAAALLAVPFLLFVTPASAAQRAQVLEINGPIGPAMADYIVREIDAASPGETGLIVLRMNTPGGLDSSMREIDTAILASPVPVATFVAPSGARAASAGTYIAYASAIAAMAPGTNIGAATPIRLGGNPLSPGSGADQKTGTARQSRRAGRHRDTQNHQRRDRLYPQPRRRQRPQRRLGRGCRAQRREPAGRRRAQASRRRRGRARRARSSAPDRRPHGDRRRQAACGLRPPDCKS